MAVLLLLCPLKSEGGTSLSLGGLVLNTGVLYDQNDDGIFSNCSSDPTSPDPSYNTLIYIGYPGYSIRPSEQRPAGQHQ